MRAKHIKMLLGRQFSKYLESVPTDLKQTIRDNAIITGGAIASMLLGEKPNDLDIYFKTQESVFTVAKHYVDDVLDRLELSVRSWICPSCGIRHDRDVNAAINILAAGKAVIASGDGVRLRSGVKSKSRQLSMKEES